MFVRSGRFLLFPAFEISKVGEGVHVKFAVDEFVDILGGAELDEGYWL